MIFTHILRHHHKMTWFGIVYSYVVRVENEDFRVTTKVIVAQVSWALQARISTSESLPQYQ